MPTQSEKAAQFRALHVPGKPLVLFNCWDVGSATAIAAGGAAAIATASWAVAAANGYADGEQLPLVQAVANVARIVQAVELPVTFDLESGYGASPEQVGATAALAFGAGAVGCNLEDSDNQQGGIRSALDHGARLAAARKAAGPEWFINARADAFLKSELRLHNEAMLAEVIERAMVYAQNGADGLFVPGLIDPKLIEQLVRASPLPVNLMASDALPPLAVLADLGVARLSYGPRAYRQIMHALQQAARALYQAA